MEELKEKNIIDKRCPICHKANYISASTPNGTPLICTNPECRIHLVYEQTRKGMRLCSDKHIHTSHKKDVLISIKKMRYKHKTLKNELTRKQEERKEIIKKINIIDKELNGIKNNIESLESQIYLKFESLDGI